MNAMENLGQIISSHLTTSEEFFNKKIKVFHFRWITTQVNQ